MTPKVFISYSWSSQSHQSLVEQWATQLLTDGIDVILDIYDLKEGNDKYVFMERMVNDSSVTHVLAICDKIYAEKADARIAGVGTESQIISKEIYEKVGQSKFIPIVCEFSEDGTPFLPTFFKSRIWLDFSSPEMTNQNWERLIRLLYDKPLHEKPGLGKPPVYITNDIHTPSSPIITKFNILKQALLQEKKGVSIYRRDFLDSCLNYADELRIRKQPDVENLSEKVLADCVKLKQIRNHIADWVLLESTISPANEFADVLLLFLENLIELKSRPPELNSWQDTWFEAHVVFVYETFLYIIAGLLKTQSYSVLHEIFTTHYLLPKTDRSGNKDHETFFCFYGWSDILNGILAPSGQKLLSPAAEFIKRFADREDILFNSIIEAELVILLMAFITPEGRWFPQTFYYASYGRDFPLFIRATQHKYFQKLTIITGISNADDLRRAVKEGQERIDISRWHSFAFNSFWGTMNMDKLDSIK